MCIYCVIRKTKRTTKILQSLFAGLIVRQYTYFLIDVGCTDKDACEIMDAAHHSLKRIFPPGVELIIHGQCTDSGGGETKGAIARDVRSRNISHKHYLITTCSLHNLQSGLRNTIAIVLGIGGIDEKGDFVVNAMQMIHGAFNIQDW